MTNAFATTLPLPLPLFVPRKLLTLSPPHRPSPLLLGLSRELSRCAIRWGRDSQSVSREESGLST